MVDITQFPIATEVLNPANYPEFKGETGTPGLNGTNAKELEVRVHEGYIQWRREDEAWTNLIDVSSLSVIAAADIYVGPTPPADTSKLWVDTSE
jgi:hypothetical protein